MFELVVGEVGAILGGLDEERDFADLVLDAWLETTEAGRAEAFDALGRRLDEARSAHEGAKALDDAAVRRRLRDGVREPGDERIARFRRRPAGARGRGRRAARARRPGRAGAASRCARPWAGRSWRGSASGPSCRLGAMRDRARGRLARALRRAARATAVAGRSGSSMLPSRRCRAAIPNACSTAPSILPNAVWRFHGAASAWTRCLLLAFRYTAVSDEKREGLVWIGFNRGTGAVIDDVFSAAAGAAGGGPRSGRRPTRRCATRRDRAGTRRRSRRGFEPLLDTERACRTGAVPARDAAPARRATAPGCTSYHDDLRRGS